MQSRKQRIVITYVLIAALLFVTSWVLVSWSATEEPFYGNPPNVMDGLLSVGLGSILAFLWIAWGAGLLASVICRKVSALALFGLLLPVVALFYLQFVVLGYLQDRVAFNQWIHEESAGKQIEVADDADTETIEEDRKP